MNKLKMSVLVVLAMAAVSQAAIITSVDRMYGQSGNRLPFGPFDGNSDPLLGTLTVGEYVYSDREFVWTEIPAALSGSELVLTFNNDKAGSEIFVQYAVTISERATIGLTIDDRIPANWAEAPSQQAAIDLVVQTWAAPGTFVDSGMKVRMSEANGPVFSVYTAELDAGTYVFGLQPSNQNFYSIIAVPEPATLMLLGLGGLLLRKRR